MSTHQTDSQIQDVETAQRAHQAYLASRRTKARIKSQNRRQKADKARRNKTDVGSSDFIASLEGFTKKNKLPSHFRELISSTRFLVYRIKSYVDEKGVARALHRGGQNALLQMLIVLLTHCDLMSGQVGIPKKRSMDTISHEALMDIYAVRFGKSICSSTWYRYIAILKGLGVFSGEEVKVSGKEGVTVRSRPSYKMLSKRFLHGIGAFKNEIRASIEQAYQKALDKGLSFVWCKHNAPAYPVNAKTDLFSTSTPDYSPH
ncbi:MAG: hypothetical protein JKY50_19425 [Oleispira sp.]|nr:hypothetical protein [Oleispira sp.]